MIDAPIGFLMALAQNQQAMTRYSALPPQERQKYIDRASHADSRGEMQSIVDSISKMS